MFTVVSHSQNVTAALTNDSSAIKENSTELQKEALGYLRMCTKNCNMLNIVVISLKNT